MDAPLIVVNFKTYSSAMAGAADKLGQLMADVETSARMVAVTSAFDLSSVSSGKLVYEKVEFLNNSAFNLFSMR